MQKHNLIQLIEFGSIKVNSKALINELGCRLFLMSVETSQSISEHALPSVVANYVLRGSIIFSAGNTTCGLHLENSSLSARVSFIESKPTNIQLFQLCRLEPLMRWRRISKNSICGPQAGRRSVPVDKAMD